MPQMSPLKWTLIFTMLITFMTILLNSVKPMNKLIKHMLPIKKKESSMKW